MAMRRSRVILLAVAAVLAAGAAFTAVAYHGDLARERARVAAVPSEVAQTRCGAIEYASIGQGPAVLLVHGAGGGVDQTAPFAQEIAARGFRVVTVSRFGYLRTPLPADASPAAQADAHACLLDLLKIPRAAVVGVSAGGPSSLQFAIRHPKRCSGLVLLVPLAYSPQAAERLAPPPPSVRWMFERAIKSDFLYWLAAEVWPSLAVDSILATPTYLLEQADAGERARVAWFRRQPMPLSERQQGLLNDVGIATSLERYELDRIAAPTLVISARDDLYGTYASSVYTAQHIPGARFLGLPDGGHLWVGHHREVMGEIVSFSATSAR
jgi:2-hydroxy-6-oxonona-2,4-dienedioate hydrolase